MSQAVGTKLRLMVVDDEPDNLDLLYRTFRREFRVYKAESGMAALELLEAEGEMAVIISDQRMPGMNGTEFLSKTVDRYPDTIRIILTGYTDVEDLVGAINSGKVFKYITKPWSPEELKSVVRQAADTYQVVKRRTDELNRALSRESLFNGVMSAIRESLDYQSMLATIVSTFGHHFDTERCTLHAVEDRQLLTSAFAFPAADAPESPAAEEGPAGRPESVGFEMTGLDFDRPKVVENPPASLQAALDTLEIQTLQPDADGSHGGELVVPLVYQQDCLAVLSLGRSVDRPWTEEDQNLVAQVSEQVALALSQAKLYQRSEAQTLQLKSELEVARQIQSNLLRQRWPELDGARVQARCQAARQVGGDFFEVYVHPQGDIWLAVGDVSGKGVPAALFMASAISVLRQELAQGVSPEPDAVMRNLNHSLSDNLIDSNRFITLAIARYTPSTGKLAYANAGHVYPMIWSHSEAVAGTATDPDFLQARGVPLGILPAWPAKAGEADLKPGDILLLASDGITEATVSGFPEAPGGSSDPEADGVMLKPEGLWALVRRQPAPFELDGLLASLQQYTQDQEDDQTILSLEVL